MALLITDSFDYYDTANLLTAGWSTSLVSVPASIVPGAGRRGTSVLRLPPGVSATRSFTVTAGQHTAIMGAAVKYSHTLSFVVLSVRDVTNQINQILVTQNADQTLSVYRGRATTASAGDLTGATLLGTTVVQNPRDVWAFLELRAFLDPAVGTIDLRLDGVSVLALTGQNTLAKASGGSDWTAVTISVPSVGFFITTLDVDDLYVCDGAGAAPWNTLLGNVSVEAYGPTGAGSFNQWSPGTGDWSLVNEMPLGAGLVSASGANPTVKVDTYTWTALVLPATPIYGVTINAAAKLQSMFDAPASFKTLVYAGATQYEGPIKTYSGVSNDQTLSYRQWVLATNPATGNAWTGAEFAATEFGIKRSA